VGIQDPHSVFWCTCLPRFLSCCNVQISQSTLETIDESAWARAPVCLQCITSVGHCLCNRTRLGVSIDWSVSIHPYGDPCEDTLLHPPGGVLSYTFASVGELIAFQQRNLIRALVVMSRQLSICSTIPGLSPSIMFRLSA
jgi:hypothetical protein